MTYYNTRTMPQADVRKLVEEGCNAFQAGQPHSAVPYDVLKEQGQWWLHGWWKSYYDQCDQDESNIIAWMGSIDGPILTEEQEKVIAKIVVTNGDYNRNHPIAVVLGSRKFTIPAPSTLK